MNLLAVESGPESVSQRTTSRSGHFLTLNKPHIIFQEEEKLINRKEMQQKWHSLNKHPKFDTDDPTFIQQSKQVLNKCSMDFMLLINEWGKKKKKHSEVSKWAQARTK